MSSSERLALCCTCEGSLQHPSVSDHFHKSCLRLQLGRRLIAETPPLPDVPDGPFLMKQEALPSMTGMIPVPLQVRVGVPTSSDGDLRQSGSSSQGVRGDPDPNPILDGSNPACTTPCLRCAGLWHQMVCIMLRRTLCLVLVCI